jgi:hypothetical protein
MPPILLQTITVNPFAGSRTRRILSGLGGTGFESETNEVPYDHWRPDEVTMQASGNPSSVTYAVDYLMNPAMTTAMDFVRQRLWAYADSSGAAFTHLVQPYFGLAPHGTPQVTAGPGIGAEGAAEVYFDFATDPADGLMWTNSGVNAYRWGHQLSGSATDPAALYLVGVASMLLELWGPNPMPGVQVGLGHSATGRIEAGPIHVGLGVGATGRLRAGPVRVGSSVNAAGRIGLEE